jgi:cyclic pyranopterin phosphate synthase
MVTADEILELLAAAGYLLRPHGARAHAPAEEFDVLDGPDRAGWAEPVGRLGVIASVTRPFCRDCDRLRLTADGQLRTCLFAQTETDLRAPLRAGASDTELAEVIVAAVAEKQAGHSIGSAGFVQPVRTMSAIGG